MIDIILSRKKTTTKKERNILKGLLEIYYFSRHFETY